MTLHPYLVSTVGHVAGLAGAWSVYSQLTAGLAFDFRVYGVYWYVFSVIPIGTPFTVFRVYSQLATGPAGAEVLRAEINGALIGDNNPANTFNTTNGTQWTKRVQPFTVPAGTRIAMRSTSGAPFGLRISPTLSGYNVTAPLGKTAADVVDDYLSGALGVTPETVVTPSGATANLVSGAANYGYGAWVQLVAAAMVASRVRHGRSYPSTSEVFVCCPLSPPESASVWGWMR